jgi:hypothetical protein
MIVQNPRKSCEEGPLVDHQDHADVGLELVATRGQDDAATR